MRRVKACIGLASTLALGACAVAPPPGPGVVAMPGAGKTFEAFQQDDAFCRQAAAQSTGGVSPAEAATNSAVGSAVLGTALGAGIGAALGSVGGALGAGAAIGGATGLLAGTAIGANNAQASGAGVQQRYDTVYAQCMASKGDKVQQPAGYAGGYPAGYPTGYYAAPAYGYSYPPPYYYPYPAWYGPDITLGFGGGWGWGGGWGHGWGWGGGWHGGWHR